MRYIRPEVLTKLKYEYPEGTRIQLDAPINDPYTKIPAGTTATVQFVDDGAQLHVKWDNVDTGIAIRFDTDQFHKI